MKMITTNKFFAFFALLFLVLTTNAQTAPTNSVAAGIALAPARFELEMKPGTETTVVINLDYRASSGAAQPTRIVASLNVIWCGDLNVAHTELDLTNPKANAKNHGFTAEERAGFDAFVKAGFLDTFREFEKGGGHYTWWSPMGTARARNVGWRIDYCLLSTALRPRLKRAFIQPQITDSDHCPVGIELK